MDTPDKLTLTSAVGGRWRLIDLVDETGSTNADLVARAGSGEDIDAVVLLAEHQSAGRGRQGRSWTAPPGSQVAMSVGVRADTVPADRWGWLPLLTGVAIVDAIAAVSGVQAGLKWPNDVLVEGRKLCGILAEVISSQQLIVVGLGINVTLHPHQLPDPNATALSLLGWDKPDRNVLAQAVLRELGARIDHWRTGHGEIDRLLADYEERSVTLGTRVRVELPGDRELHGRAVGIGESGQLRVQEVDGAVTSVSAGDVVHLRPN